MGFLKQTTDSRLGWRACLLPRDPDLQNQNLWGGSGICDLCKLLCTGALENPGGGLT